MVSSDARRAVVFGLPMDVALALFGVWIIWGTTYAAASYALTELPPLMMTGARFFCAGILMLVFLKLRHEPMPSRVEMRNSMLLGALLIGATGTTVISQQYIHSSFAAIMGALTPMTMALMSAPFIGLPRRGEWLGILIGLIGLLLLIRDPNLSAQPFGLFMRIISMFMWCGGSVISSRVQMPKSAPMTNALQMFFGGGVVLLMAFVKGESIPTHVSLGPALAWLYLLFIGGIIGYGSFLYVMRKCRPALATSYAYVNPIVALVVGAVFLGDQISPIGFVAIPLVLLSVVFMLRAKER
jgi:drug/metabolite transporter (DMT)-like permease